MWGRVLWKLVPDLHRSLEGSTFQTDDEDSFTSEGRIDYLKKDLCGFISCLCKKEQRESGLEYGGDLTDITEERLCTEQLIEARR